MTEFQVTPITVYQRIAAWGEGSLPQKKNKRKREREGGSRERREREKGSSTAEQRPPNEDSNKQTKSHEIFFFEGRERMKRE